MQIILSSRIVQVNHRAARLIKLEEFDTENYVYTLTNGEELWQEMDQIYMGFADWLGTLEM